MIQLIHSNLDIEASPAKVWSIIVDFAAYPEWNPFIRRITGSMRVGSRLTTDMHRPGGRGMTLRPAVLAVVPERELRWIGSLGVPGVSNAVKPNRDYAVAKPAVKIVNSLWQRLQSNEFR